MRLIDCEALEKAIYEWMPKDLETWMDGDLPPIENLVVSVMMTIQEQPTVDAMPVVHGRWLPENRTMDYFWVCSECKFPSEAHGAFKLYKYCPNCGARMDGEQDED